MQACDCLWWLGCMWKMVRSRLVARSNIWHKSGGVIAGGGQEASVGPWSYGVL